MPSRRWNFAIVILFIVFACLLLQFVFSTMRLRELVNPKPGAMNGNPPPHVVLIAQEIDNPYWRTIEEGAREASEKYGMNVEYTGPIRINPAEQIRLLEKAIAAKADAILVQGINDPQQRLLIGQAADKGIPVITVDADEPYSRRLSYIGTNNLNAGKTMGELVAKAAGGEGSIGVLIANENSYSQQLRLAGFREVIGRYPDLDVVGVRASDNSRLQGAQQAEELLAKYPQVRYMIGFSALDGLGILEAANRESPAGLKIFAFDDLSETKEAVRQCKIVSTIVQQPHEMGYGAISMLHDYFQGKKPAPQYYTQANILTGSKAAGGSGGSCP
ncbi:substrate-binding domain-containing protein [Paenibacillus beijingensis]|uniref:LacI family transcriptional regulator n=1 Tax=Paenibacillus beijingensis TaxID=1126833 RepID=A0A0D5NGZ7_9BACL|nr:substrate-binding domain-containing protein [Paenibacillus beijingensis]AJY74227.1 LacI family transcriptional regulator [Paenibacillus beijingensis]